MRGPVCIEWEDASFDLDGDGSPPDAFIVETYGWITGSNTAFTTVASERLPEGGYRCLTHIPHALIRSIVDLEEGDRDHTTGAATAAGGDRVRHLPSAGADI